jgi:Ran GTPase-activating protein (RanGAP) involved in mRNA processing and transport
VKLLGPRKPAINFNMRNSTLTKHAGEYLFKAISSPEYYLTSLNLKFCYLSFEQLIALGNALRFNKTIVKLNLSSNALKPCTARFILDAMLDNVCLSEVNFSSNFLDDEFAVDLAHVLEDNPVLYKVDIASNPIGPAGGQAILTTLLMKNETLGSLGNLDENVYMGVRLREELRQVLHLNNISSDKRNSHYRDQKEASKKTFVVEREGDDPRVKREFGGHQKD